MKGDSMKKRVDEPPFNKFHADAFSAFYSGSNDEFVNFIFSEMPVGIVVLKRNMDIIYSNKKAALFLNRFKLPKEILSVSKRIFDAMNISKLHELFPGEIYISKKFKDSPSNWIFRLCIFESPSPLIVLYILEDKISNKLNINAIRQQYRLTRRESDILRRVLDGLKNAEISKELHIIEQTVKDHLTNIYMKLGVENRMALIRSLLSPSYIQH
jgi:DNA-binding CsgD family transcriptional regulator